MSVPDFIIGGAMKCATTTLHHILGSHSRIFIPERELKFFSLDDMVQQPEFFYQRPSKAWVNYDYNRNHDEYLNWYSEFFKDAPEGQLIGEDTPTYLAAEDAPHRIKSLLPEVKLIFLIRNPVSRVYSHYWHWVRSGRAFYSFEDSIRFSSVPLVQRSFYFEQLQRYYRLFDRSQIRVVVFEEFLKNPKQTILELQEFLGVEPEDLDADESKNTGNTPRFLRLKLWQNRLFRDFLGYKHSSFLPHNLKDRIPRRWGYALRLLNLINPNLTKRPPPISQPTRDFLTDYLARKNEGLSELIGKPVGTIWGEGFEQI